MLTLFCKHPAMKYADLSSLHVIFVGGAPLSVHLARTLAEIVPQAFVEQSYGMTELTGILTMPPLDPHCEKHWVFGKNRRKWGVIRHWAISGDALCEQQTNGQGESDALTLH
ncbi:hypothetical protein B0H13DRAFT_2308028 [Mycena leptocephala]|nr:hypothetical protein B0H13DRAFT_2308028 [Mycena leptocephala]